MSSAQPRVCVLCKNSLTTSPSTYLCVLCYFGVSLFSIGVIYTLFRGIL
jgi:hypothetical protein